MTDGDSIYIYIYIHMHICMCIYIYTYTHIYTHIHVNMYVCIYVSIYLFRYMYSESSFRKDTWGVIEFLLVFLLGWGGSLHRLEAAKRRIGTNARWASWLALGRVICQPFGTQLCPAEFSPKSPPASILPPSRSIPALALSGIQFHNQSARRSAWWIHQLHSAIKSLQR